MLARYTIYRRRPKDAPPLPDGIRQDTRWRTKHVLRPQQETVEEFLTDPSDAAWHDFKEAYTTSLVTRFQENREPFEQLARLASEHDVFLGCNCPTRKNPNVQHCHTYPGLVFMKEAFPELHVVLPDVVGSAETSDRR